MPSLFSSFEPGTDPRPSLPPIPTAATPEQRPPAVSKGVGLVSVALLLAAAPLRAEELPLEPEKTIERTLEAGSTDTFSVTLTNGWMVHLTLRAKEDTLLSAIGPSGKVHRKISTQVQEGGPFTFLAREGGPWNFVIQARDARARVSYTLSDFSTASLELPPLPGERMSARLQTVKNQADADALWKELEMSGTPLVESITDDPNDVLVTYLWRGDAHTQAMLLECALTVYQPVEKWSMKRVLDTDVWFKSLPMNRRARDVYRFIPNPPKLDGFERMGMAQAMPYLQWAEAAAQGDPLNPKVFPPGTRELGIHRSRSFLELPEAPPQPWADRREDVPRGTVEKMTFSSAILKNQRDLHVYLPPGYSKEGVPCNLLLAFDGMTYIDTVPTPVTLDNLLAENRIAPTVAVMIGNAFRQTELTWNREFADFLAFELVPWLRQSYKVTEDPRRVILAGSSLGGLASASAAFHHPDVFGNVLSQSGSFWWTPPRDPAKPFEVDPRAEPTYVAQQFLKSPKLPIRFYLDAGLYELDHTGKGSSILLPNRHLRDVLRAKGYEVFHQEFPGGHDYAHWRGTIATGLILLQ